MATAAPSGTPVTNPASPEQKKKARPNPARRKAARTRSDVENAPLALADSTPSSRPQLRRVMTIESIRDEPSIPRTTNNSTTRPATIPRQKTEPQPVPRQQAPPDAQSTVKRPPAKLMRTVTAPPTMKQSGTLALQGPALMTGGLVGCAAGAAVLLGVQLWYDFAGAESAILAAKSARLSVDNLSEELITSLKTGTYSADEALDMLRRTTLAYASTIPGGASFVERVFREIDTVRKQRGREVDKVVAETYTELARAGKQGASSVEMRDVVVKQLMKLSSFASNVTQDVVTRNPKLRPFTEEAARSLKGPSETGTPTVRINMALRQKQQVIKR